MNKSLPFKRISLKSGEKLISSIPDFDHEIWDKYKIKGYNLDDGRFLTFSYTHYRLYCNRGEALERFENLWQQSKAYKEEKEPPYTQSFPADHVALAAAFIQKHLPNGFDYTIWSLKALEKQLQVTYRKESISKADFFGLVAVLVRIYLHDFPGAALKMEYREDYQLTLPFISGPGGLKTCPDLWLRRLWYDGFEETGQRIGMYKEMKQQRARI
jgi:hypothetical protein